LLNSQSDFLESSAVAGFVKKLRGSYVRREDLSEEFESDDDDWPQVDQSGFVWTKYGRYGY